MLIGKEDFHRGETKDLGFFPGRNGGYHIPTSTQ